MTKMANIFLLRNRARDIESSSPPCKKRERTALDYALKIYGGIADYFLALGIFFSLGFALQDLRLSGCKVTRGYYQLMTAVPFLGLAGSFILAHFDPHPKMVLEKSFYIQLWYWPSLTPDDKGWTAFKRSLPSVFITIALISLTVLIAFDQDNSSYCIAKTKGYTFTLAQWRAITTASYSLSTLVDVIVMISF